MGEFRSSAVDKKTVFLNGFYNQGSTLLLYERYEDKHDIFRSFIECGLKNDELCIYASPHKSGKVNLQRYFKGYSNFHQFCITGDGTKVSRRGCIDKLDSKLIRRLHDRSEGNSLRLLVDFGMYSDAPMHIETDILKNSAVLDAYNLSSLNQEITGRLIESHEKVIISGGGGSIVYLSLSPSKKLPNDVPLSVVSCETMERCVKKSLDVIVLSMLQQRPMCGFGIIKAIARNFGVLLNLAMVYSFLYSLERQGYLKTKKEPDNKTKTYIPTESGKRFIKNKIEEYALAQKKISDLIASDSSKIKIYAD